VALLVGDAVRAGGGFGLAERRADLKVGQYMGRGDSRGLANLEISAP